MLHQESRNPINKASSMLLRLAIFSLALLTPKLVFTQSDYLYSEARVINEHGEQFSTQITVNFKPQVFAIAPGTVQATIADIVPNYPNLITAFNALEQQYGKVIFQKQIPEAVWGDV